LVNTAGQEGVGKAMGGLYDFVGPGRIRRRRGGEWWDCQRCSFCRLKGTIHIGFIERKGEQEWWSSNAFEWELAVGEIASPLIASRTTLIRRELSTTPGHQMMSVIVTITNA
jgi:hypothetical protein